MDGPIFYGACHDVFLCNIPSSLNLDATEHLQHHALLDHTHKKSHFHGSLSLLLDGAISDACDWGIIKMNGCRRLVMA